MSSQPPERPAPERRSSLSKYMKRIKTHMRRGSSSRDESTPPPTDPTPTVAEEPVAAAIPDPVPDVVTTTTTTTAIVPVIVPTSTGPMVIDNMPVTSTTSGAYFRSAIQQERARALFAKYGLTLEDHEWITTGTTAVSSERVEKTIRMRVRRQCHRCQAHFGHDKVCSKCEHKRCKKCPAYPPKKVVAALEDKGKGAALKEKDVVPVLAPTPAPIPVPILLPTPIAVPAPEAPKKTRMRSGYPILTKPSPSGGPDFVRKHVSQRVRRTCHKCEALFVPPTETVCSSCQHVRCVQCPRDPLKPKKYPHGYPGDAPAEEESEVEQPLRKERTWRKPRQRIRWTCDKCSTLFMERSKVCGNCSHNRCDTCTREPPKKVKKEFDPEVVKSLEEKLARLKMP